MAKTASRDAWGRTLVELGAERDFNVLTADLADSVRVEWFKKEYPDRFYECGIAEANMIGVAAGIASTGKKAVVSGFAMFVAGRAYDQIRNSVAYSALPVVIGATHAGISVGEDGPTHQCCEDIALMRVIPGMTVLSPSDAKETALCVRAAMDHNSPVYIRLSRYPVEDTTPDDYTFEIGKGVVLKDGTDVTIVATGITVEQAVAAGKLLEEKGISAAVINIHTIKPLDAELIGEYAKKTGKIITVEEHSVIGGLGSAVAEALSESGCGAKLCRMGLNDTFGTSGKAADVIEYFGLTAPHIVKKAEEMLA
ncbi:MAG: transketolase family protein [Clostridia bacterium]|nr:transketolase family protein [Clostridia bacterium]